MSNESSVTLRGIVEKVIPSVTTGPDIVQIAVIKAEELYREIRIPNT